MEENNETVVFNNKKMTKEEFNEAKEKAESQKGVKVVQTESNTFKTRLQD